MSLTTYNKKRDFKQTSEPAGKKSADKASRFVIQRHHASHLHYDFRLELGGVLKSWAVPKGPSLNPTDKRLAMMVEDHPVSYIDFKGTIPEGNYGAGKVIIWDKGNFLPINKDHEPISEKQALADIKKGEIKFFMNGKKLKGEFVLVHLKNDARSSNSWLLIKHRDEYAVDKNFDSEDLVSAKDKKAGEKNAAARKTGVKKAAPEKAAKKKTAVKKNTSKTAAKR
ncbi:MAG: 3'-phosphoesterase [Sphingobacteriales bacterium]|nr:MAG: 3'-phosphoesterase [Sphingobacteriales bacterium]